MNKYLKGLLTAGVLTLISQGYAGCAENSCLTVKDSERTAEPESEDASERILTTIEKNMGNINASRGYLEYLRQHTPERLLFALAIYLTSARKDPSNIRLQFLLAYTYYELYRWKYSLYPEKGLVPEGLSIVTNNYRRKFNSGIDKAIQIDPNFIDSYCAVLDMALLQDDVKKATWAAGKILAFKPGDMSMNLTMAELCFRQMAIDPWTAQPKYLNKTIHYSKIVLILLPENLDALRLLAGAYEMGGHYEKALPLYKKCIALDPDKDSGRAKTCSFWISKVEKDMKSGTRRPLIPLEE